MGSEPERAPHSPGTQAPRGTGTQVLKSLSVAGGKRGGKLRELALRLYDVGFNVIPIGEGKKPIGSWSAERRLEREELERRLRKAQGIAICGGPENPWKPAMVLAIIDIDNPRALEGKPVLRSVVASTVHWLTGPRCPSCGGKQVERSEGGRFRCKCGAEFEPAEAARGVAALVAVELSAYERYLRGTKRSGDIEVLVNNYALVPPSLHPSGVRYEWVKEFEWGEPNYGVRALVEGELVSLLEELEGRQAGRKEAEAREEVREEPKVEARSPAIGELRELSDAEVLELKNLLRDAYVPGNRQYIWLFLSGWAAKAKVSPTSIAKVLKLLYEETQDSDPIKTRASALVYSYKKAGINVDAYAEEFKKLFGVEPYGLEREIREEEVSGKSGLQELLEQVLGQDRALAVLKRLEEVLGTASPFRDSVFKILNYARRLFAVANLRRLAVVTARIVEEEGRVRVEWHDLVAEGAPTSVEVYVNPITGSVNYRVVWEARGRRPLEIGPAAVEDIVARLTRENLVYKRRVAEDVIGAVLRAYEEKGRATVKEEIEAPGFYWHEGRVIPVRYEVKEPSPEELKQALELLDELATQWFAHAQDRFAVVVKWGIVAPFNYVLKQRGRWLKWLYLYGASRTGKTTLGEVVLRIWDLDSRHARAGASIDTPARIGHVLSQSTFPTLVNEPGGVLLREDIVDLIKDAVQHAVARSKHVHGVYTDILALSPLIFTSNRYLPRDDALLSRLLVLRFTYGERIPEDRAHEFEAKVKPRLGVLRYLGQYVVSRVVASPDLLSMEWEDLSEKLLEEAYAQVGLQPPGWVKLRCRVEETIYEDMREAVRAFLVKRINEEFSRFVGRVSVEIIKEEGGSSWEVIPRHDATFRERVLTVLRSELLSWARLKGDEVYLLTALADELRPVVGDIGGLKSVAELLGWEYKRARIGGRVVMVAATKLEDFVRFLRAEVEDQQAQQQGEGQQRGTDTEGQSGEQQGGGQQEVQGQEGGAPGT